MGRQNVVVVFGLVFLAVIGLAAAAASPSPSSSPSKSPSTTKTDVEAPITDDQIGTTGDDAAASPGDGDVAVAGPLGSDSSYDSSAPSDFIDITDTLNAKREDSAAVALSVSAVVIGVASIAGSFLLF